MNLTKENIKFVKNCAAEAVGTTVEFMEAPTRKRQSVIARQLVMYFFRKSNSKFEVSLREIGEIFGKDHATALHAYKQIKQLTKQTYEEAYLAKELFLYYVSFNNQKALNDEINRRDRIRTIEDIAVEKKMKNLQKYSSLYKKAVIKMIRTEDEPPTERDFNLLEHIIEF